jgi:octaprenyl-diphosphate synthase
MVSAGIVNERERIVGLCDWANSPATLVHDDVVDDSNRRRVFSINALWKNKIAVLVGDYLLSKDCCFLLITVILIWK